MLQCSCPPGFQLRGLTTDYNAYGTTDFRSGVYVVGFGLPVPGVKSIDLPDGSITLLSAIFKAACARKVKRSTGSAALFEP